MLRRRLALVALVLPILAGCVPPEVPGTGGGGSGGSGSGGSGGGTVGVEAWRSEMLTAVNAQRAAVGAAPLTSCAALERAAQAHSADQAATRTMSHTGSDGSTMRVRVERAGYLGWTGIAENVAAGYPDVVAVMAGWMGSSGHRANLLAPATQHLGMGLARAADGTPYWTQNFGRNGGC